MKSGGSNFIFFKIGGSKFKVGGSWPPTFNGGDTPGSSHSLTFDAPTIFISSFFVLPSLFPVLSCWKFHNAESPLRLFIICRLICLIFAIYICPYISILFALYFSTLCITFSVCISRVRLDVKRSQLNLSWVEMPTFPINGTLLIKMPLL